MIKSCLLCVLSALFLLMVSSTVSHAETNLILHYTFDTDNGTNVLDQSGLNHTGTVNGATWNTNGISGGAFTFNGTSDFISVADNNILDISGSELTISAWVRPSAMGSDVRPIVSKWSDEIMGNKRTWYLAITHDTEHSKRLLSAWSNLGTNWRLAWGGEALTSNEWQHVAATIKNGNASLYIDGKLDSSVTLGSFGTFFNNDRPLYIGAGEISMLSIKRYFSGDIDEVKIYDRSLSGNEIENLYLEHGENDLILYYDFDNNSGTNVLDQSGTGNTGTVYGATWISNGLSGGAYSFNGTNSYISVPDCDSLDIQGDELTIVAWVRPTSIDAASRPIASKWADETLGENRAWFLQINDVTTTPRKLRSSWSSTGSNMEHAYGNKELASNEWQQVAVAIKPGNTSLYIDGQLDSSTAIGGYGSFFNNDRPFYVGAGEITMSTDMKYFKGDIDEVRIYKRALRSEEIHELFLRHIDNSLVLHMTFDNNEGVSVSDVSGNGNHGTVSGAAWASNGISGGAYSFNGTSDFISIPDNNILDIPGSELTISAWVKPSAMGTDPRPIVSKWADELLGNKRTWYFAITHALDHNKRLLSAWSSTGVNWQLIYGNNELISNEWQHVAITMKDGDASTYVNGINDACSSLGSFGTFFNNDRPLYIGAGEMSYLGTKRFFSGLIDEVRVYNRALTPDEIDEVYQEHARTDLVLYYSFDENSSSNTHDRSGSDNNGNVIGATWTGLGKSGGAYYFDGSNDYISVPDSDSLNFGSTNDFSVGFWVRTSVQDALAIGKIAASPGPPDNSPGWRVCFENTVGLGNGVRLDMGDGSSYINEESPHSTEAIDGTWHHVFASVSRTNTAILYVDGIAQDIKDVSSVGNISNSVPLLIGGTGSSNYFKGTLDELRIYRKALTEQEITEIYARDADDGLVLHYSMETNASEVVDLSGHGNHGTIYGATWANNGISGGSYSFDGINDYIMTPDSTSLDIQGGELTIAAWIRPSSMGSDVKPIVSKWTDELLGNKRTWYLAITHASEYNKRLLSAWSNLGTNWRLAWGNQELTSNEWQHVVATIKNGNSSLYINGQLDSSVTLGSFGNYFNNDRPLYIGAGEISYLGSKRFFSGNIDEVRIYNRALSSEEVRELYENKPPVIILDVAPANGTAPLIVTFDISQSYDSDGSIVKWELDRDGNGSIDSEGTEFGKIMMEYPQPGTFSPVISIVDDVGAKSSVTSSVVVWGAAPVANIEAVPTGGPATLLVDFYGTNSAATSGHSIMAYEWDFNNDGVCDAASTNGSTSWIYRESGSYTAVLKVTDDQGLQSSDTIAITVTAAGTPPSVTLSAIPAKGDLPLDVQFTASASDADGYIVSYKWDFDNDGTYDLTTTNQTADKTYSTAGSYQPRVTVIDNSGLSSAANTAVQVVEPSGFRTWVSWPKQGRRIWGQKCLVRAHTAPRSKTALVKLQYKLSSATNWIDLGTIPGQHGQYDAFWTNVESLDGLDCDIRSVAVDKDTNTVYSFTITVKVDSGALGQTFGTEETDVSGKDISRQRFSSDQTAQVDIHDRTKVIIHAGTFTSNNIVEIELTDINTNTLQGSVKGKLSIDKNRRVSVENEPDLVKPMYIDIPYSDDDDDGIVDGTTMHEKHLSAHWFDTASNCWRRALSYQILAKENCVRIRTHHLTEFGIFGNINLLLPDNGGMLLSYTSQASNSLAASNLNDDNTASFWQSETSPTNQEFIFAFSNYMGAVISSAMIHNYGEVAQGHNRYSQNFDILSSMSSNSGFSSVINGTLTASEDPEVFTFSAVTSRYVKLVISSGTDSQAWDLAEFSVMGSVTNDPDADLMPDAWEMLYFNDLDRTGTNDLDGDMLMDTDEYLYGGHPGLPDTDADGMNDFKEKIAGTGIADPNSIFKISNTELTNSITEDFVIGWNTVAGRYYSVLTSTNLTGTNWHYVPEPEYSNKFGTTQPIYYTNNQTLNIPRYFRIQVEE